MWSAILPTFTWLSILLEISQHHVSALSVTGLGRSSHVATRKQVSQKHPLGLVRTSNLPNISLPQCYSGTRKSPKDIQCPAECPYLRSEPTHGCSFKCVVASDCGADNPLASFPDPETKMCTSCQVQACEQCGAGSRQCAVCHEGFSLHDGSCWDERRWFWRTVFAVIALSVLLVVGYLGSLIMRPISNSSIYKHALNFRRHAQLRSERTGHTFPLWETDVRNEPIAGVGATLHFSFQFGAFVYACIIAAILTGVSMHFGERPDLMKMTQQSKNYYDACGKETEEQFQDIAYMEHVYFWVVLALYIISTVGVMAFSLNQRRQGRRMNQNMTTMQDYVLIASNLPHMAGTEKVQSWLKGIFQAAVAPVHAEVVGVSVCWDYTNIRGNIDEQVALEVEREDVAYEASAGQYSVRQASAATAKSTRLASLMHQVDELIVSVGDDPLKIQPDKRGEREVQAMLESLWTSGYAFIVFNTEAQRDNALEQLKSNPLSVEGRPISVDVSACEPETVIWHSFAVKPPNVHSNIAVGVLLLIAAIFILDVVFYFPSVGYILHVQNVRGIGGEGMKGTLLGLLVCVCNQIIYVIIGQIADWVGFKYSDAKETFYVVGYTVAVFINTIIDLYVVLLLAQGYTMEQAIRQGQSSDSSMSMKAIAENPSMQMVVYLKYTAYIFPSCLLIPFLAEPVAGYFFFLLKCWIVRSREDAKIQEAEEALKCPPFDLARYGDILVNIMLCCGVLAFTFRDLYVLWACLALSLAWIFCWDKARFLRVSSRSVFVSLKLDHTAQYLASVPCGILAACLLFRIYGQKSGRGYGFLEKVFEQFDKDDSGLADVLARDTVLFGMVVVILLHVLIHSWVLLKLDRAYGKTLLNAHGHNEHVPWSETAASVPCSWFNANPVHCLRSKYVYQHKIPCLKYAGGKEYLLRANPDAGCFYENKDLDFEDDASWMKSLQSHITGGKHQSHNTGGDSSGCSAPTSPSQGATSPTN